MASGALLRRLLKARDLLHADVSRGITLDELAKAAGLSRAHLAREFADTFGLPPHQYLVQLRLDLAKRTATSSPS
jgi:AraC-like DNA-binding protein